ncbi:MAG: 3-dehydroquinate synthase [candidate division KSB1 bacterium]|nr:3-dehydroquinate synthase [candidate division KSB1 bacterium]
MKTIQVDLGERSYMIYIGGRLQKDLAPLLRERGMAKDCFLVTDQRVEKLYGAVTVEELCAAGFQARLLSVPVGEESKSLRTAENLYTELLQAGADRRAWIAALGGGVVGDLAGFVAATYLRGVPFVQIPTTLLAQVDSSVGGKVGVNHPLGKNLIGAFYQPQFVFIDPQTLHTLPERELRAGAAEVIKYGLIRDRRFFVQIAERLDTLFALADEPLLEEIIATSCSIKAQVVSQDERESGLRAILNFGHTVGHALEAATGFAYFLHGEAVVHGMKAALRLSQEIAGLPQTEREAAEGALNRFQPPSIPGEVTLEALIAAMGKDKKRSEGRQAWVLLRRIGEALVTKEVPNSAVLDVLTDLLRAG